MLVMMLVVEVPAPLVVLAVIGVDSVLTVSGTKAERVLIICNATAVGVDFTAEELDIFMEAAEDLPISTI